MNIFKKLKQRTPWELFFDEKIKKIFLEGGGKNKLVVDIGGGLRVAKDKNNRYAKGNEWVRELLTKVDYKVLDPVPDYNPDIIGDIQNLDFKDNSIDAYVCIAVLEHVPDPIKSAKEMYRTLKQGGEAFIYVPFLYYYHPMKGYYGDYWRFTEESLKFIFRDFKYFEIVNARGAIETLVRLSPLGKYNFLCKFGRILDKIVNKDRTNQTAGFNVFLVK